ncbi:3-beta hydroxysteroid dehydrogenase/isomerase family protein [Naegleria gruberi]|uniref:3-beta hydroxysteroid dehydrogenase/isomerase family protein n=1 Tax=Naegleria gruberi TaxID=5762 RepID=D2VW02_NAEGR|nr:3-beta hydroxysteroid dehydrogenase/isomerase family protein [Naegleria gruberi]EFC38992.1 3-beta hydroxysteroid dehydrogenase/isomerase family protein [Naegleria gruberi]|eukprot:XP_002671736.1 3-beta hydroxysteroid dehydrogenase/isomerase family protein [Naegleria gruberi strain NEG-M]
MSIRVCVTGGTGFVASHLVYQLLLKGYHVNTTIRDLKKKDELRDALLQYHKENCTDPTQLLTEQVLNERLSIFEADLMKEGSFADVIKGCRFVHHVASPYKLDVKDAQQELVDPAVKGTLNILNECIKLRQEQATHDVNRLQRVIITSSIVAICDTAEKDKIYTEDDWNELSTVDRNPYYYSKVTSEKAAWKLMKEMQTKHGQDFIELATINPSGVIGKPVLPQQVNQTHDIVAKVVNGEMPALIAMYMTFVDVKDVALSHVKYFYHPKENVSFVVEMKPSQLDKYVK